jgi:hypothetical protein
MTGGQTERKRTYVRMDPNVCSLRGVHELVSADGHVPPVCVEARRLDRVALGDHHVPVPVEGYGASPEAGRGEEVLLRPVWVLEHSDEAGRGGGATVVVDRPDDPCVALRACGADSARDVPDCVDPRRVDVGWTVGRQRSTGSRARLALPAGSTLLRGYGLLVRVAGDRVLDRCVPEGRYGARTPGHRVGDDHVRRAVVGDVALPDEGHG